MPLREDAGPGTRNLQSCALAPLTYATQGNWGGRLRDSPAIKRERMHPGEGLGSDREEFYRQSSERDLRP